MISHKFFKALGCFSFNPVGSGCGKESHFLFFFFISLNKYLGIQFCLSTLRFYMVIYMNELVITNYLCYSLFWQKDQ